MLKNKRLTSFEEGQVTGFIRLGVLVGEISKKICRSRHAVQNFIDLGENYGMNKRAGRKKKLSPRDGQRILHVASNKSVSLSQIKSNLELPVHKTTVWRVLKKSPHIQFTKMKGKPPLNATHKLARLTRAKKHMTWSKEWNDVVFSDEKKWNLDGPNGYHSYWHDLRKENKYFSKRQSGGGSVMIWTAFASKDRSNVAFISGTLDSQGYTRMLKTIWSSLVQKWIDENGYFSKKMPQFMLQGSRRRTFFRKKTVCLIDQAKVRT